MFYNDGFNIIHNSHNGCPFPNTRYGLFPKKCEQFNNFAEKNIIDNLVYGDVVVIYNYHLSHLGDRSLRDVRHNILNKKK